MLLTPAEWCLPKFVNMMKCCKNFGLFASVLLSLFMFVAPLQVPVKSSYDSSQHQRFRSGGFFRGRD